jgi:hypothetical protein
MVCHRICLFPTIQINKQVMIKFSKTFLEGNWFDKITWWLRGFFIQSVEVSYMTRNIECAFKIDCPHNLLNKITRIIINHLQDFAWGYLNKQVIVSIRNIYYAKIRNENNSELPQAMFAQANNLSNRNMFIIISRKLDLMTFAYLMPYWWNTYALHL